MLIEFHLTIQLSMQTEWYDDTDGLIGYHFRLQIWHHKLASKKDFGSYDQNNEISSHGATRSKFKKKIKHFHHNRTNILFLNK